MAGKLSPSAQTRLALLEGFFPLTSRLHTLIEQWAVARAGQETLNGSIKRAADQLKLKFMGVGLDSLSQQAGAIAMAAARGGNPAQKARILRENMASLKFQLDLAMRTVVRDDMDAQAQQRSKEPQS